MGELKKKTPPKTNIKCVQFDLFSKFISNDVSDVSNAIEMWENIPKYFPAQIVNRNFTEEGLAHPYTWKYQENDAKGNSHILKVVVQPALIEQPNGRYKAAFPGKTEEAIEEVLKKFLTDQRYGLHDPHESETWIRFTLSMIYKELRSRGCSRSRQEIKEAVQVMSKCNISVFKEGKEIWNGAILQDLVTVSRSDYLDDTDSHHIARLPLFISKSIDRLEFRQFNYDRLMNCKEQLSRWIYKRLIHRFKQASQINSYHFTYKGIKNSGLLQQSTEARNRVKVISSLDELVSKGVLSRYESTVIEQEGRRILDIKYTVFAAETFICEQKASNKRSRDLEMLALNNGWSIVDN